MPEVGGLGSIFTESYTTFLYDMPKYARVYVYIGVCVCV